jgi:hypothetical protein
MFNEHHDIEIIFNSIIINLIILIELIYSNILINHIILSKELTFYVIQFIQDSIYLKFY